MNRKNIFISLSIFVILVFVFQKSSAQSYELVWADEFDLTGFPDPAKWNFEIGNNHGANSEWQYYKNKDTSNCWISNGTLVITALKEDYSVQHYTSTRINTKGKAEFKYGKIEARMKLPYGQGIWPAFWTLGGNYSQVGWPACGEIDIMELIGGAGDRDRTIYGTAHWKDAANNYAMYGGNKKLTTGIFNDDFHLFSIEWTSTYIKWYLDGVKFHEITTTPAALSEFQLKHFIILNLAVGGTWPGYPDVSTVFPQKFEIDYVRVYQLSNTVSVRNSDTGIKQMDLFPNPVNDLLNINLKLIRPGDVSIALSDISGKEILSAFYRSVEEGDQKIVISDRIRSLQSGIYFIQINTPGQKYFSKFLKN